MSENEVILSGLIKGAFEDVSNDGIKFNLLQRGKSETNEEFILVAYGDSATFLKTHSKAGNRVVIQGRLSNEKLGTENYHSIITVGKVLSIAESSKGVDYNRITISGNGKAEATKSIGEKSTISNLNIANKRYYKDKSGETKEYTTYVSATIWNKTAEALANARIIPFENRDVLLTGVLKPRTYEKEDGSQIAKIDVWVNDLILMGSSKKSEKEGANTASDATKKTSTSKKSAKSQPTTETDSPF